MKAALDLSGLAQFSARALWTEPERVLLQPSESPPAGVPMEIDLDLIDFDPAQPRRSMNTERLAELAASIVAQGVLQPVLLRDHPDRPGRFIVNRGERRVRASRLGGRRTVPAWIDEKADRYAQAIENLQREDLSPFELARFVADREAEGDSRATIAAKLHKPASFITEVASLLDAPEAVKAAYDSGRARDTRVLYRLARMLQKDPAAAAPLLASAEPITRSAVSMGVRHPRHVPAATAGAGTTGSPSTVVRLEATGRTVQGSKTADALLIEYAGRRGRLGLSGWPGRRTGEVRFDDGTRQVLDLGELKLIAWTAR